MQEDRAFQDPVPRYLSPGFLHENGVKWCPNGVRVFGVTPSFQKNTRPLLEADMSTLWEVLH